jgi:hypothetical protein
MLHLERRGCFVLDRHYLLEYLGDDELWYVQLADDKRLGAVVLAGAPEVVNGFTKGLLQLAIEGATVFGREVDAGFVGVARDLAEATRAGLEDKVLAGPEFTGEGASE